MNTNYKQIKSYISGIEKYQIKSKELDENNNKIENISINYKLLNEDINNIDKDLITNLIKNKLCKELFFDKIEDIYVFNQNSFIEVMFNTNEYMEGSYTKYSSDIGLFLKDEDKIQLNFPYKDCVLVGGMDKEDDKVNLEVFYNEILERDKINKLFEPKVFHNIKKLSYSKELSEDNRLNNPNNIQIDSDIDNIKFETIIDENGFEKQKLKDNLLIKGNNLLGLHSLVRRLSGSIDVIYIDPPYYFNDTKAADSFAYNSNFKLSTWLTFMKNRLEIARELLSETGVIFISMNEDGNSYLKLLCDDVFGLYNFISNMYWKNGGGKNDETTIKNQKENILVYSKNGGYFNLLKSDISNYKFEDEDGKYSKSGFGRQGLDYIKSLDYPIEIPKELIDDHQTHIYPGGSKELYEERQKGNYKKKDWRWTLSKKEFETRKKNKKIIFEKRKDGWKVYYKSYYENKFTAFNNIIEIAGTSNDIKELFGEIVFNNPKPVALIKHLLKISSKENSIILDFFGGSGTTAHSVLSLNKEDGGNRKFILLEQMDYIESITAERIKRSMIKEGYEDSFIYMEMKESNTKELKNYIKSSKLKEELISLINDSFDNGYFINIDNKEQLLLQIENMYSNAKNNKSNPLNDSIKLLIEKYMDNNLDYVSYEDIEELKKSNKIKENEYKLNKSFYEEV